MNNLTYLQQLRALRKIATDAVKQYSLDIEQVKFINHGENTTYRLTDSNKVHYLLRIHRVNYHTKNAIQEELKWLQDIDKDLNLTVPLAIKNTKSKQISIQDGRYVTVMKWIEGRSVKKDVTHQHIILVAELMVQLHKTKATAKERIYWDTKGLLGSSSRMGNSDKISGLSTIEQTFLASTTKLISRRLSHYETNNKNKMGMIHADLHFGNFFLKSSRMFPIDFDDCGFGFYMYDIAVFFTSLFEKVQMKLITKKEYTQLINSFIEKYNESIPLSDDDLNAIDDLIIARRLLIIQWLNSRDDHPIFMSKLVPFAKKEIKLMRNQLKKKRR
jgi:Ser/Thr protein kinase RdoA (MazF antagonist)